MSVNYFKIDPSLEGSARSKCDFCSGGRLVQKLEFLFIVI